ncbi:MAG TPA: hypothetical protein VJ875_03055 [Pyrinomonadaceae bacterium]|nr:hypothetical protein [Pyrinomonadaceae bacterium]
MGYTSHSLLWGNILRAAEADPREASSIRGISGLEHPVIAVGIDDKRNRLLVISAEHDARSAALAQADIQSASHHVQVVFARPIAVNFAEAAVNVSNVLGQTTIGSEEFAKLSDPKIVSHLINPLFERIIGSLGLAPFDVSAQLMQVVQQLSVVEVETTKQHLAGAKTEDTPVEKQLILNLDKLIHYDPTEKDRMLGLCPIPLYDFSAQEIDILQTGSDLEAIRHLLRTHELLQYFFPAADQLALGLIHRGLRNPSELAAQLAEVPQLGHPYGPMEITGGGSFTDVIEDLREQGMVVEGEIGYEVTPQGASKRTSITFKPRESLISKILNRFSVNLDLKDLWKS